MRIILFLAALFLIFPLQAEAQAHQFGVSQIKTQGTNANDEFIELLNPGESVAELGGFKLVKETAGGNQYTLLTFGQTAILPQSYYLVAHKDGVYANSADATYQTSLADHNRLYLLAPDGEVLDTIAWGTITGAALPNPGKQESIHRQWQEPSQSWSSFVVGPFEQAHRSGERQAAPTENEGESEPSGDSEAVPHPTINELSLWPDDGDTFWIEIYNPANEPIDVSGWTVQTDGQVFATLSGRIEPRAFLVVFWPPPMVIPASIHLYNAQAKVETWDISSTQVSGTSLAIDTLGEKRATSLPTAARPNVFASPSPVLCEPAAAPIEPLPPSGAVTATSGRVRLNEVFANPEGDENATEFIELYNEETFPINLSGWTIADASKSTILSDKTILGSSYLVLKKIDSLLTLNNSDESIKLSDVSGNLRSAFSYETTKEGLSLNWSASEWYEAVPTPNAHNEMKAESTPSQTSQAQTQTTAPTPSTTSAIDPRAAMLRINELLPNPSGSDDGEWIELHNTSSIPVETTGLALADPTKAYALPKQSIPAFGYLVVQRADSGLALNNDTDRVQLLAGEKVLDEIFYENSAEGQSWARTDDEDWRLTDQLTPGERNVFDNVHPVEKTLRAETTVQPTTAVNPAPPLELPAISRPSTAKSVTAASDKSAATSKTATHIAFTGWDDVKANEIITMNGVMVVAPGTFNEKTAYIQGEDGQGPGVELYFTKAEWPGLDAGDVLQVTGKKSSIKTGRRLLVSATDNIIILDHFDVEDVAVAAADLTASRHNTLIKIEGTLSLRGKSDLEVAEGSSTIPAKLAKAKLFPPELLPNATGSVIGLYQHGSSPTLWPRTQDDIVIDEPLATLRSSESLDLSAVTSTAAMSSRWLAFLAASAAILLGIAYYFKDPILNVVREQVLFIRKRFSL